MTNKELLIDYSNKIKVELSTKLSSAEYMLWVFPITPFVLQNEEIVFVTPSENVRDTLNNMYHAKFLEAANNLELPISEVLFLTKSETSKIKIADEETVQEPTPVRKNPFVAKYTFENFVIADNNRFASTAAQTVAQNPGANDGLLTLNPLYIYGGVGLGKTHLLHAIGNYLFEMNPTLNVVYTTAEKISNDYFASLNQYSTDKDAYRNFRKKYAESDVLMVDDIQFMQKKGGLQEVFFHIFNDLYINGKQIILSSDRPPKEINDIEDRLRSRFESGLMTDISEPSLDTRINIINKKLEFTQQKLSSEVVFFLAERVDTNIRELEGALLKILMFSQLTHRTPSIELAKEALKEKDNSKTEQIDSEKIINSVCEYYRVSASEIIGKKKTKDIVEARMIAIYLVCDMLNLPLMSIGQIFGGRDHTTIMYSRDKIASQISTNKAVAKAIGDIKAAFNCR